MSRARLRSVIGTATVSVALLASGTVLTGCAASSGGSLGHQACADVARAVAFRHQSDFSAADRQLQLAEPLAAQLAGSGGSWQALSANLGEIGRVPIHMLMPALQADCPAAS
ncbi:MAG: hypothetical protein ACYDGN_01030 [Acidimicrobiales bacterium]